MIGYMIEQELGNLLPFEVPFATVLTMVEVDREDPGFQNPTKFIGPVYGETEAERLKAEKGWAMKKDGDKWRRVVASPQPKRIFEMRPIKWLLEKGTIVIAAGGGGIPTVYEPGRKLRGIEAVIDKDLCSELLARDLEVDLFIRRRMPRQSSLIGASPRPRPSAAPTPMTSSSTTSQPAPWDPRSMLPAISPRPPASAPPLGRSRTWPPSSRARPAPP
jgi:hypothetical protein